MSIKWKAVTRKATVSKRKWKKTIPKKEAIVEKESLPKREAVVKRKAVTRQQKAVRVIQEVVKYASEMRKKFLEDSHSVYQPSKIRRKLKYDFV